MHTLICNDQVFLFCFFNLFGIDNWGENVRKKKRNALLLRSALLLTWYSKCSHEPRTCLSPFKHFEWWEIAGQMLFLNFSLQSRRTEKAKSRRHTFNSASSLVTEPSSYVVQSFLGCMTSLYPWTLRCCTAPERRQKTLHGFIPPPYPDRYTIFWFNTFKKRGDATI